MADEVKAEVIKKTQRTLGKYVKKPPLTEKLLRKPPFRFLHDVTTVVIRETGFLRNLFTEEELNSDIKDKEAKIAFLTKLINVVSIELAVRPSKVIAGQEPTRTNELLQTIARALDKNIDSTEAVQHYKANLEKDTRNVPASKPSKRDTSKTVTESKTSRRSDHAKGATEHSDTVAGRKTAPVAADHKSRKPREQGTVKNRDARSSSRSKQPKRTKTVSDDIVESKSLRNEATSNESENQKPSVASPKQSVETNDVQPELNDAIEPNATPPSPQPQTQSGQQVSEKEKTATTIPTNGDVNGGETIATKLPEDVQPPENVAVKPTPSIPDPPAHKDPLRPMSGRPASARPAAPKLRWKPDITEKYTDTGIKENDTVIVEHFDEQNDDNDSMVILETERNDFTEANEVSEIVNGDNTQEHGYLVAQILETQRELAKVNSVDLLSNKIDPELKPKSKKDTEIIEKEVENLRGTIQSLIRATHPMGKLLDFLQEDVELMQKELTDWRSQYAQFHNQLEIERTESEATAHPLQESFDSIQAGIGEQLDKIYQVKLNIMKNNYKIQQLLLGRA